METLEEEVKKVIIDALQLDDIHCEDIDSDAPLLRGGLGLDDMDALEVGIALHRRYGVKVVADAEETQRYFASVRTLAALVAGQRTK